MNITIIGNNADIAAMNNIATQLRNEGHNVGIECPVGDESAWENAKNTRNALLWLSSNTSNEVYSIAKHRSMSSLSTINLFAEGFQLPDGARSSIGMFKSIFLALNPSNLAIEILELLGNIVNYSDFAPMKHVVEQQCISEDSATTQTVALEVEEQLDETGNQGLKPWKALLVILGVFPLEYFFESILEESGHYYKDDILPYILFAVSGFIEMACVGGVVEYRKKNGKTFFSRIVMILGICMMLFYGWLFIKNL